MTTDVLNPVSRLKFLTATCQCVSLPVTPHGWQETYDVASPHIVTPWWRGGHHGQAREVIWWEEQYGTIMLLRSK